MIVYLIPIIIIIIDQVTKILIFKNIPLNNEVSIFGDILIFQHIQNEGVAFGISLGNLKLLIFIITIIMIFFISGIFLKSIQDKSLDRYPLSFILGGAIGNIIDRGISFYSDHYSGVIDFIKIGFNGKYWYVFNIADIAITLGVIIFFIIEINKYKAEQHNNGNIQ